MLLFEKSLYIFAAMFQDIDSAVKDLMQSDAFKQDANLDPTLRVYEGRFNKGKLGATTAIRLLKLYGYKVEIVKGKK